MRAVFLSVLSVVIIFGIPRAAHEFRSQPAVGKGPAAIAVSVPQDRRPAPAAHSAPPVFSAPAAQAVLVSFEPAQPLHRASAEAAPAPDRERARTAKLPGEPLEVKLPEDAPLVLTPEVPAASANGASANAKAAAQPAGDDRDYLPPWMRGERGRATAQADTAVPGGSVAEQPERARRRHHRAGRHARERRHDASYRSAPSRRSRRSHRFF